MFCPHNPIGRWRLHLMLFALAGCLFVSADHVAGQNYVPRSPGTSAPSELPASDTQTTQPENAPPLEELSPTERVERARETVRLLSIYRSPTATEEERRAAAEQLLAFGDESAKLLFNQVHREFEQAHTQYLKQFENAAIAVVRNRWSSDTEQEIEKLRKTVAAVTKHSKLTKEMIKEKADPAMRRLEELLAATRTDVLDANETLRQSREKLLALHVLANRALHRARSEELSALADKIRDPETFVATLQDDETFAADMATPMTEKDRETLVFNREKAREINSEEAKGILILNLMRIRLGKNAGRIDIALCDTARDHSEDMARLKFFSHDSPVKGKEDPWKRAKAKGTTASGENIYMGNTKAAAAIQAWWYSPGHHKNMMRSHERVGLGQHNRHWTQLFGK